MGRIKASWVLKELFVRTLGPSHIVDRMRLRRAHRKTPTVRANSQLDLYSRMLPGDFLHYGYFEDPDVPADSLSFDALHDAQLRYAEKLLDLITASDAPVLDVGCGMGGLLGMLRDRGHTALGLTPDEYQMAHIRSAYPDVPVLNCRFEDTPVEDYRGYFGTVVHSESIQYMRPDCVFRVMKEILAPGGTWIVSDYFRLGEAGERSGWQWDQFEDRLVEHGFQVVHSEDVTRNVLPTLAFAHNLGSRIGLPAYDFASDKLRVKKPGLHYIVQNVAERGREAVLKNLSVIDPERFARTKRYMLMSMTRPKTAAN